MPNQIDADHLRHVAEYAMEQGRAVAQHGDVATYIPALADADPERFGLVVSGVDGQTEFAFGDADLPFPIQSISKVFALVLAGQKIEEEHGVEDEIWRRVGREPSGTPFNSLVQLEHERGIPRNPMINAGALVICDVLLDRFDDVNAAIIELTSELAGEDIPVDERVAKAEGQAGKRNLAMANLIADFGNLNHSVDDVLDAYVHQCALSMTARQLARATRFLANDGVDPATGKRVLSDSLARRVNAIMLTCGTYDAAGEFAYNVGLPCKSGVAGGIIATVPHRMGVCVWSPPLDPTGNSRGGARALHHLAEQLDLSIF